MAAAYGSASNWVLGATGVALAVDVGGWAGVREGTDGFGVEDEAGHSGRGVLVQAARASAEPINNQRDVRVAMA